MRSLALIDGVMRLRCHPQDKDMAKSVLGAQWDPQARCWTFPMRPEIVIELNKKLPGLVLSDEVKREARRIYDLERQIAEQKKHGWEGVTPLEPMPVIVRVEPYRPFQHQVAAYNMACQLLGIAKAGDAV